MTEQQAIAYIHSLLRFGVKPGLERIRALCRALGNPQNRLRCVHIAGTNGKGSTSTMLAGILSAAGYQTGLFTSPYVWHFRERFCLNGEMIHPAALAALTEEVRAAAERLPELPTEFEFITALALLWYARTDCDAAVLEVGLGGRWDATNVIPPPLLAVIAKISLDHVDLLGHTVAEIAAEKCGILKPGSRAVTCCEQLPEALAVIRDTARRQGVPLEVPAAEEVSLRAASLSGSDAVLAGLPLRVPLLGEHMCRNALTAVTAARQLRTQGFDISDEAIVRGIGAARMPARMEVLSAEPPVLLDGGHNADGADALAKVLDDFLSDRPLTVILGMMRDKDRAAYLGQILPRAARLIACTPRNPRALPARELAALARTIPADPPPEMEAVPDAAKAAALGWKALPPQGALLICGSFYLASELNGWIDAHFPGR
ncbi:MAG: bifunctional folylpolyglutamate synthase/dihydrofolate synthase [Oscillospiraceae bacterium]|jgi:dihydrofolate synthase/folylpolyglutamate synthase|nr:bifunctional folylpolyglutamate synthase/dihydrofolate synthase [Oscillospiraceae bacterium]